MVGTTEHALHCRLVALSTRAGLCKVVPDSRASIQVQRSLAPKPYMPRLGKNSTPVRFTSSW